MKVSVLSKKTVAFLMAMLLMLSFSVSAQNSLESIEGETPVLLAKSENLELYVDPITTAFTVKDLRNSTEWASTIADAQSDPFVGGIYITEMQSLLSIEYYDADGVMNNINSYASSVMNDDYKLERIENGYRVTYTFDDGILTVPMEIKLDNDVLSVDVLTSKLKVGKNYSIAKISVLPFFASAQDKSKGYILVPDGCGGLIDFEKDKTGIKEYSRKVYGENISEDATELYELQDETPVTLPVYGIKRNDNALFCVITHGESMASINAFGAKNISSQNNVFAKFSLYGNMEYTFSQDTVVIFEKKSSKLCDISEKFYFIQGENADYNGMASLFKNILLQNGTLSEKNIKLEPYITVYGGITVKRSFFGFLIDSVKRLTTTSQVEKIAEKAIDLGIESPVINYTAWNKQQLNSKPVTNLKMSPALKSGSVSLDDLIKSKDFTFIPSVDNTFMYQKSSNIISRFTSPATNIAGTALYKKDISQTTFKEYGNRHFFLNKKYLKSNLEKIKKSANKMKGDYLGLSDVSSLIYEDYSKSGMKRYDMQEIVVNSLEEISKERKLLLDNPNFYAFKYADRIINLPMRTSENLLIDEAVPFLQLVLSGSISYASDVLNNEDQADILLKLLETGSMPHYFMYYSAESTVKNTEYSSLSSGGYEKNLKLLSKVYEQLENVYSKIGQTAIQSHQKLAANVFAVEYKNGAVVYVNYSDEDYVAPNGTKVLSHGYVAEVAE